MRTILKGFTLIELVMVIVILSIIAASSSVFMFSLANSFITNMNLNDAYGQGQMAAQRMSRDLRTVRSSSDITTAGAHSFAFNDINGNTISYSLSSNNLILTKNGSAQTLATGLNSLNIFYLDANENSTTTASAVRFITAFLSFTLNGVTYSVSIYSNPRNAL